MEPVATTALWTAMARAQEHARSDRLFEDPYAGVLAGPEGAELWSRWEQQAPEASESGAIPIRTRFFDDVLVSLVCEEGVNQVVLLGAGLETMAFRLQQLSGVTMFELDYPELLTMKEDRLRQVGASSSCRRITLGTDLNIDWTTDLRRLGFEPKRPTAWLLVGLLLYLEEAEVHQLFNRLGCLVSGPAWLLADIMGRSYMDSPVMRRLLEVQAANGSPLRFGTDDPRKLLAGYEWDAEITHFGDEGANFGRWGQTVTQSDNLGQPHAYLVVARHTGRHAH